MNETQILIKTSIENETKQQLGVDVIVEYVPNISLRKQELQKQAGEKFNSVYNADHFTGTFIPAIGNNPYYILVQENRESMLDIMTAFHEYKHLIDYVLFFKVVCDNDIELLKKSQLVTAWDTFSDDTPGQAERYDYNGKSVYDLPDVLKDWGIYLAETRAE